MLCGMGSGGAAAATMCHDGHGGDAVAAVWHTMGF